ncbi:DUF1365 domain-containing protein [Vibrio sp.]|uniref:DUF1365 domain-containing protein n=1 Tax=Vibrio sp. TaxID=678 RepID=UPI003D112620
MSDATLRSSALSSRLYVGEVRHRRFQPVNHHLVYRLFMPCIDLDEIETLEKSVWGFGQRWWHWARFYRPDYLGVGNLKQAVLDKVAELAGETLADGQVKALIHLRYLGIYFSPVNFYYVYDQQGHWRYLLAEVSNTPWNERHYYLVPADPGSTMTQSAQQKAFHVSPFNPMNQQYHWRIRPLHERLWLHLQCQQHAGEKNKEFDATLAMRAHSFSSANLLKQLVVTPIMAVKVVAGIYWHAAKLWWKGAPVYSHPSSGAEEEHNKEPRL